jgi:hypothetical protein
MGINDSTEILANYFCKIKLNVTDKIKIGDESFNIDKLQQDGIILLKELSFNEYIIELPYIFLVLLNKSCKDEKLQNYINNLIDKYNSLDGKNFELFNLYFITIKLLSFKILKIKRISLEKLYNGAKIPEKFNLILFDISKFNKDDIELIQLKSRYPNDKNEYYSKDENKIELKPGKIYLNGGGAEYSDIFYFLNKDNSIQLIELAEQYKYTINIKENKNIFNYEFNKVKEFKREKGTRYFSFISNSSIQIETEEALCK